MTTRAIRDNYLALQRLIVERLADQVPGVTWRGIEQYSEASEESPRQPTGYVMWDGDRFPQGGGAQALGGAASVLYQRWMVLLSVRDASQARRAERNAVAGPFLLAIHKAVAGWKPIDCERGFYRTQGRNPAYRPNGALLPLTFEIQLFL